MNDTPRTGQSIATVERDTGIGRDTLRIWERRYGFPQPHRNAQGQRLYPETQVRRLQLIRRLLDQGWRPGRIVALAEAELQRLSNPPSVIAADAQRRLEPFLLAVREHQSDRLYQLLRKAAETLGTRGLILHIIAPCAQQIGELWAAGDLHIFEEHLFTRAVTRLLDGLISAAESAADTAPVLLATLTGEPHGLGLLMAETLLCEQARPTLNLGMEVPLQQLLQAAHSIRPAALALSFSSAYPYGALRANLGELRAQMMPEIPLWIGGGGTARLKRLPTGVLIKSLQNL